MIGTVARWVVPLVLLAGLAVGSACGRSSGDRPKVIADRILIEKAQRRLTLFRGGQTLVVYKVALGENPIGPKEREGDGRTPEGSYVIDRRVAASRFHRALHVSYPNDVDRRRSAKLGVDPGGDIMIHGIKNGLGWMGPMHRASDWTLGCIAVTDGEIEEIWDAVPDGTPVQIVP